MGPRRPEINGYGHWMKNWLGLTILVFLFFPITSLAGKAGVVDAQASCSGNLVCQFTVTVQHADEGWEHYADLWEVLSMNGKVLGIRKLVHPHLHEQPFTRSLSHVKIPPGTKQVRIRARDSVHGNGGKEMVIDLPQKLSLLQSYFIP